MGPVKRRCYKASLKLEIVAKNPQYSKKSNSACLCRLNILSIWYGTVCMSV